MQNLTNKEVVWFERMDTFSIMSIRGVSAFQHTPRPRALRQHVSIHKPQLFALGPHRHRWAIEILYGLEVGKLCTDSAQQRTIRS